MTCFFFNHDGWRVERILAAVSSEFYIKTPSTNCILAQWTARSNLLNFVCRSPLATINFDLISKLFAARLMYFPWFLLNFVCRSPLATINFDLISKLFAARLMYFPWFLLFRVTTCWCLAKGWSTSAVIYFFTWRHEIVLSNYYSGLFLKRYM
jgi:hypothetical protein